jgi:hypothetical protein
MSAHVLVVANRTASTHDLPSRLSDLGAGGIAGLGDC